jgi:hypothetical protein
VSDHYTVICKCGLLAEGSRFTCVDCDKPTMCPACGHCPACAGEAKMDRSQSESYFETQRLNPLTYGPA